MDTKPPIEVGIGIVRRGGTGAGPIEVLISRRTDGGVLGGYWEFPGGKLEPHETSEACVVRELREELGVAVRPVGAFAPITHTYDHGRVVLRPFLCAHVGGEPRALEVAEWRWVGVGALAGYRFPPANEALLVELQRRLNGDE